MADHAGNLPSDGYQDSDGFYREAKYRNAGWMPHREALDIIEGCLREYTDRRAEGSGAVGGR